jgi:acetyltransferase-like isoleucine patch superfamily enzyme
MPTEAAARIIEGADVDPRATIGSGSTVWDLAKIRENAQLGSGCVIGRGVYVGPGVRLGDNVKVQNYALVYEPAVVEDGVFIGPAVVFTNDTYPRAVNPDGSLKSAADWAPVGVTVRNGASVGARSVCVAPVTIGRWALVAAGATVVSDVPDFALVAGVPARQIGWVGKAGVRLAEVADGGFRCPQTGEEYVLGPDGTLREAP